MAQLVAQGPVKATQLYGQNSGPYAFNNAIEWQIRATGLGRLVGSFEITAGPPPAGYPRIVQRDHDGTVEVIETITPDADGAYAFDVAIVLPYVLIQLSNTNSTEGYMAAQLLPASGGGAGGGGGGGGGATPNYDVYRSGVAAADGVSLNTPVGSTANPGEARSVANSTQTFCELRFVNPLDMATVLIVFYNAANDEPVGYVEQTIQAGPATVGSGGSLRYVAPITPVPTQADYADVRVTAPGAAALDIYLWGL